MEPDPPSSSATTDALQTSNGAYHLSIPTQYQLLSSADAKPPLSMKSRGSCTAPDDSQEATITGIRYPPSWGQHRSMSPKITSRRTSHHGAGYDMPTSDPPKAMVSFVYDIILCE